MTFSPDYQTFTFAELLTGWVGVFALPAHLNGISVSSIQPAEKKDNSTLTSSLLLTSKIYFNTRVKLIGSKREGFVTGFTLLLLSFALFVFQNHSQL